MKSLTELNYDITDYIISDELEKVAEITESLPEAVKLAHIPTSEEQDSRKDSDFALILWHPLSGKMRKYAAYSPELVRLNMSFLEHNLNSLPEEIVKVAAANITCAAYNKGVEIPDALQPYTSKKYVDNVVDIRHMSPKLEKTAEVIDFAIPSEKKFPLDSYESIKKACVGFERNYPKFSYRKLTDFVRLTKEAAQRFDVPIEGSLLNKFASLSNQEFNPDIATHIQVRKNFLKDDELELSNTFDELLKLSEELGPEKTAHALYLMDAQLELTNRYGRGIEHPSFAVKQLEKVASLRINGTDITNEMLKKASAEDLTLVVGNDYIGKLRGEEGLEVLASLPTPVKNEVAKLCARKKK